jgi:L-ascorbate metabolism protein UlaG (beta-lactamase superfamily)
VGDVIGFALNGGAVWISGDTVLYEGVRSVADRLTVDVALIHLGGVQFGVTGPLRYTMTARDALELCDLIKPRLAIPIHYEGWKHFREGRAAIERTDKQQRFRWIEIGVPTEI